MARRVRSSSWLPMVVSILVACSPSQASPSGTPVAGSAAAAGRGICATIAAMPDLSAAERTFTNDAHAALHALAAAPGLDHALAGRVLVAMDRVHADFTSATATTLAADLHALATATGQALLNLREPAPPCD